MVLIAMNDDTFNQYKFSISCLQIFLNHFFEMLFNKVKERYLFLYFPFLSHLFPTGFKTRETVFITAISERNDFIYSYDQL